VDRGDLAEPGNVTGAAAEPVRGERAEVEGIEVAMEVPSPGLTKELELAGIHCGSGNGVKEIMRTGQDEWSPKTATVRLTSCVRCRHDNVSESNT
jgi:hypothetical protein